MTRRALPSLILSTCLLATACGPTAIGRAIDAGQIDLAHTTLSAELARGRLGAEGAASVARALLSKDIAEASGRAGAERLVALTSCAREVDSALAKRDRPEDALGGTVALVRVDGGAKSAGSYSRWLREPTSPAGFRAAGARSLTSDEDGALRRRLIADPDEDIRKGALQAALEALDPQDADALLEAARLDPSPAARHLALRAAGALGGEKVVFALEDLWHGADEETREQIALAWSAKRTFEAGGQRKLTWILETQRGIAATAAALTLIAKGEPGDALPTSVLVRTLKEGSSKDRIAVIEAAPFHVDALRALIVEAEGNSDEAVAAAAMARHLLVLTTEGSSKEAPQKEALTTKLLEIASKNGPGAVRAKGVLARLHVKRLTPYLLRDGAGTDMKLRAEAGTALAVMGDLPNAALIGTDPDARVRTTVSCAVLRAWGSL